MAHTNSTIERQQFVQICACGCGQPTLIAGRPGVRSKQQAGQPSLYLNHHHNHHQGPEYLPDENGCWIWQHRSSRRGYGRVFIDGANIPAHRLFYERKHGPIPDGLYLDHLCRNPPCVNPDHLEPVTPAENTHRSSLTKLTTEDVSEIRELAAQGVTQQAIADRFRLNRTYVSNVVTDKWRRSG